jgi:UDP-2-acetamido-2,6-beta-L-arabino-hexul-4-ose reductase
MGTAALIGITGGDGFLGWHLRVHLLTRGERDVLVADRGTWACEDRLGRFVEACDVIFHLAGATRGEPDEVRAGNEGLAESLCAAKRRTNARFSLIFANSVKAPDDGVYGESKHAASVALSTAQAEAGDLYVDVVLPHLFGEHGRPHHNSAVATFAHQLAVGEEPEVMADRELELLHAQDACAVLVEVAASHDGSVRTVPGKRLCVSEALARLERLASPYLEDGSFPDLPEQFDLRLFNMLRSHLFPRRCPRRLVGHSDARGSFYELARAGGAAVGGGQTSVSTTVPGVTRGDHFHLDKVERFVVVSGDAVIKIRRLFHTAVHRFEVSGREPVAVDIPTLHTHNMTNVGSGPLVCMFWSNDHYDPASPDTTMEIVEPVEQPA